MAKLCDEILVVDIEATCWEKKIPPAGQRGEIIEIGIAIINLQNLTIVSKESILVSPIESMVSDYCTTLTSLTQLQVEMGIPYDKACTIISNKYKGRSRTWGSWGNYDRIQIGRQCQERGIIYPFGATHLNIKNLFTLRRRHPKEVGMAKALKILGIELEGRHHRGDDDAYNTAKILIELLK